MQRRGRAAKTRSSALACVHGEGRADTSARATAQDLAACPTSAWQGTGGVSDVARQQWQCEPRTSAWWQVAVASSARTTRVMCSHRGGSEGAVGATARAGWANSDARLSSGGDRGQRWLCSKYVTCTLFKAVEKLYPMILLLNQLFYSQ